MISTKNKERELVQCFIYTNSLDIVCVCEQACMCVCDCAYVQAYLSVHVCVKMRGKRVM